MSDGIIRGNLRGPGRDLPANRSVPDFSTFESKQRGRRAPLQLPRTARPVSMLVPSNPLQDDFYEPVEPTVAGGPHPILEMVSGPVTRGFGLLFGTGRRGSQAAGAAGRASRGPTNKELRQQIIDAGGSAPKSANKAKLNEILGGLRGEGRTQGTLAGATTTPAPTTVPRTTPQPAPRAQPVQSARNQPQPQRSQPTPQPQPAPQSTGPMRGPTGGFNRMTEAERNLRGGASQGDDFLAGLNMNPPPRTTPPRTTPPRTQQPAAAGPQVPAGHFPQPAPRTSGGASGRGSRTDDFLEGLDMNPAPTTTPPRTTPPRTSGSTRPRSPNTQVRPLDDAAKMVWEGVKENPALPIILAGGATVMGLSSTDKPKATKPKATKPKATTPKTAVPRSSTPSTTLQGMAPFGLGAYQSPVPRSSVKESKTPTPKPMPAKPNPFPGAGSFGGGFGPRGAGVGVQQQATPQFGFTPNTDDMVERKKKKAKKQYRDLEDVVSAISTAPIKGGSHLLRGIANFMYRLDD